MFDTSYKSRLWANFSRLNRFSNEITWHCTASLASSQPCSDRVGLKPKWFDIAWCCKTSLESFKLHNQREINCVLLVLAGFHSGEVFSLRVSHGNIRSCWGRWSRSGTNGKRREWCTPCLSSAPASASTCPSPTASRNTHTHTSC